MCSMVQEKFQRWYTFYPLSYFSFSTQSHASILFPSRSMAQCCTTAETHFSPTRKCVLNRDIPRSEYSLFSHLVISGPNLLKCGHARSAIRTVVMRCVLVAGDSEQSKVHERIAALAMCLPENTWHSRDYALNINSVTKITVFCSKELWIIDTQERQRWTN